MKRFRFPIVFMFLFFVFSGCSKPEAEANETTENPLYAQMTERAVYYSSIYHDRLTTKSGDSYLSEDYVRSFDINAIDEKYLEFIDMYIEPENVTDWNERLVLDILNEDSRFSYDEKMIVVDFIAGAYVMKKEIGLVHVQTKGDAEQCEREFKKAIRRATRDFAIAMCIAALEPTFVGELAATTLYYCWIDDAEEDYNDCMADA